MENKDLRQEKGSLTYHQIANKLDVHHKTVQDWFQTAKLDESRRKRILDAISSLKEVKN